MFFEFIAIFILSFIFIYILKKNASKIGLLDVPNGRSVHVNPVPSSAGIGFYLAIVLVVTFFHFHLIISYSWTLLAILIVFIVGVLDDHHDTSHNTKFIMLAISTVVLSLDGLIIDDVGTFFTIPISLGWFAIPFTVFAVTGFSNALNLIDGLDGLAASVSIVILGTFFILGYQHDDLFMMILSMSFIAGLLAFLVYNWVPASIFMGDSGSLTVGFVISVLAIKALVYIPTISVFFIAALPVFDTLIVMIRRKVKGVSMFSADRCHIHHLLRHFFMKKTKKTVLFLVLLQMIYSLTGLQFDKQMDEGFLLILFILNTILLYLALSAMIKRQKINC